MFFHIYGKILSIYFFHSGKFFIIHCRQPKEIKVCLEYPAIVHLKRPDLGFMAKRLSEGCVFQKHSNKTGIILNIIFDDNLSSILQSKRSKSYCCPDH